VRNALDRDVVNIDLIALDQEEKEIEWAFENLEFDLVIGFHAARPILCSQCAM
jgi:hypothetical protein